jgi:hypothetical protein
LSDQVTVDRAERSLPGVQVKAVVCGGEMLVTIIQAVTQPVFDRRGHARAADAVEIGDGHSKNSLSVAAEGSGVDDIAAEVEGKIDDGSPGGIEAAITSLTSGDNAHAARMLRITRGGDCHLVREGSAVPDTSFLGEFDVSWHKQGNEAPALEIFGTRPQGLGATRDHAVDTSHVKGEERIERLARQITGKRQHDLPELLVEAERLEGCCHSGKVISAEVERREFQVIERHQLAFQSALCEEVCCTNLAIATTNGETRESVASAVQLGADWTHMLLCVRCCDNGRSRNPPAGLAPSSRVRPSRRRLL